MIRTDPLFTNDVFHTPVWLKAAYPETVDARACLTKVVFSDDGALPLRIKEVVAVAILSYHDDPSVEVHMRRALAAGSTLREIIEGILAACTPGGQPCLHHCIPTIKRLAEEIGEDAKKRGPGPIVKARTHREHTAGRWDWMEEVYPAYQQIRRDINELMLMPEDASLEVKYREMVVAAILSCRAYPTVPHHLRRAVQEGGSVEEMVETMQVAALLAGAPVFHYASTFIIEIQKEIAAGKLVPAVQA